MMGERRRYVGRIRSELDRWNRNWGFSRRRREHPEENNTEEREEMAAEPN